MKNTEIFVSFFLQQICKQPSMQFSQDIYTEPFNPQKDNLKQIAHYFQISLHHPPSIVSDQQIMSQTINSTKSNTILMDVLRTRSTVFTKQERTQMQKMLHHFCRLSKLEYKQGLNQILAPFELFRRVGYTISQCYALFKAFFDTYCLNFYYDKDFNSLEIIFRMVSVVIKYHDPALARYLENYQIEPQIYCISWLMTLFSSKLSFKLTYVLWQFLTTEKDDYLIFFLIVAIIIMRKEEIIQTKQSSIFSIITNLIFRKEQELKHTIKVALLLRRSTPASLILFFKETKIFREKKNFSRISDLLTQINKINVFLVGSGQISLRQHLNLGLCESHCYFCSLRQPLKLAATQHQMIQYFPNVYSLVNISNDLRTMNFEIDFVIIDIRGNKQRQLPSIKGLNIYKIDVNTQLSKVQAQFNEQFMQFKGKQHFLFLLNQFSFEQLQKIKSKELQFSTMLIKILNSYSYNYLSILQGGQDAYFDFLRTNKMKSQIINSKLVPVSEYIDDGDMINTPETFVGMQDHLKPSQIINIQYLYDNRKIEIFEGAQGSENNYLLILQGLIVIIQRTKQIQRLFKQVKQKKSALSFLIEQQWTAEIPLKIVHLHSIYLMDKLTVRLHHNNCLIIYLKQSSEENDKNYRSGFRAKLWRTSVDNIVKQDLQRQHFQVKLKRINFDTQGFEAVKQISQIVKQNYKEMVRVKRMIEQSQQRNQNLNNNVIDQNQFQTGLPSQN